MRLQKFLQHLPGVVLISGLAITYNLQQSASEIETQNLQNYFNIEALEVFDHLEQLVSGHIQILQGTAGLFAASTDVTRQEFQDYLNIQDLPKRFPGIQSIGFAKLIRAHEKTEFIHAVHSEGFQNFTIFPSTQLDTYSPYIFIEPFEGSNLAAFGFDPFSEPLRKKAMEIARDTAEVTLTSRVTLTQEKNSLSPQPASIMYFPIYRNKLPINTVTERRSNILGWVFMQYRLNDLLSYVLGDNPHNFHLKIVSSGKRSQNEVMYDNAQIQLAFRSGIEGFQLTKVLKIFEQPWIVTIKSNPIKNDSLQTTPSVLIRVTGTLISIFIALIIWQLIKLRGEAARLVQTKINQLQESEKISKNALTELQYQRYALDQHLIVASVDKRGDFIYVNDKFCQMTGYSKQELLGHNYLQLTSHQHSPKLTKDILRIILKGAVWSGEAGIRAKEGNLYWVLATIVPFLHEKKKPMQYIVLMSDITALKNADQKLKKALTEKEALLKEVYHRVKNNLQVVSSLINLQARSIHNEEALSLLNQSRDRIKSIALLHEKLYQSKDLEMIDFNDYIQDLIKHLLYGYRIQPSLIQVQMDIENVFLDLDTAIPCGLIINELVSNALMHAFPSEKSGHIRISFTHGSGQYILVIADNGTGFPMDVDFKKSSSLGLQLVNSLTRQLEGDISLNRTDETIFTLSFSAKVYQEKPYDDR